MDAEDSPLRNHEYAIANMLTVLEFMRAMSRAAKALMWLGLRDKINGYISILDNSISLARGAMRAQIERRAPLEEQLNSIVEALAAGYNVCSSKK